MVSWLQRTRVQMTVAVGWVGHPRVGDSCHPDLPSGPPACTLGCPPQPPSLQQGFSAWALG